MKSTARGVLRSWTGGAALLFGVLAGCGGGGGGGGNAPATAGPAGNAAPQVTVSMSGPISAGAASGDISTFTSSVVSLDAGSSKDPDGDALSYHWSVISKPQGSNVAFQGDTAARTTIKTDIAGTYVLSVRVTDSRGASADRQVTILANTTAPVTTLSMSVSYSAVPTVLPTRSVAVSAVIVLDASASKDPDGDPVSTTWELIERPGASRTSLTVDGGTARFVADVVGLYKVRARGTDPSGAYSESVYPVEAVGYVPQTVITGSVINYYESAGSNWMQASLGSTVALSSTASRDPEGLPLTYRWVLRSKPAASTAQLSVGAGEFSQLTPDVMGDYIVSVLATDPSGGSSSYETTVSVHNRNPQAVINTTATPVSLPTGPAVRLPVSTTLTLRGTASVDPDGDALTYDWSLVGKPPASMAALSGASSPTVQLTTDVAGRYQVRLRVTDTTGAFSEKLLIIESGNASPVAVTDKTNVTVLAGVPTTASAALSYDDDSDALTYSWALDARPSGSNATIAAPGAAQLSFTPDVAGTYVAAVTVSDGKSAGVGYVTIKALSSTTSNVTLSFAPLEARYSRGLDRFVAYATNPNALHIIDPFSGATRSVPLPLGVKSLNLSGDGKLAAVLHDGIVSLVDIASATLLRSSLTGGMQSDAFVSNAGLIYLVGKTSGGWAEPEVTILNGRSGDNVTNSGYPRMGTFYGNMRGIYAESKNKGFVVTDGLSPADISYFSVNPSTGLIAETRDSPYHGDYGMSAPFYLSTNEDLLFTSNGNIFRTDTLQYVGRLSMSAPLLSMSHAPSGDETIVLSNTYTPEGSYVFNGTLTYKASYHRFMGALFLPDADIALPLVGGQQSYGINLFHSANGNHVALVQTGSALKNAAGIRYYLVTR